MLTHPKQFRAATTKLRKYYRTMGFKNLPGTAYMFLNHAHRAPKNVLLNGQENGEEEPVH